MAGMFDEDIASPIPVEPPPSPAERSITIRPVVGAPAPQGNMFDEDVGSTPVRAPVAKNEVDWSRYNQPFGELKQDTPSFTEYAKQKTQDAILGTGQALGGHPDPYMARNVADTLVTMGGFSPMGTVLSAGDTVQDVRQGHYGRAAVDAIGAVPGVMQVRRLAQKVGGTLPMIQTAATPTRTIDKVTGAVDDELLRSGGRAYDRVAQAPIEYHPNAIADYAQRAKYYLQQPGARGVFSPESAPGVFSLLDRRARELRDRGVTSISPRDFETLRQQLKGFSEGADSAAGQRAASILENYMHSPPPGAITSMAPGAMDTLRADLAAARGDWRSGKTAETVEQGIDRAGTKAGGANSGLNVGNNTRQVLGDLATPPVGATSKIFGATYPEKQSLKAVSAGDWLTNKQRYIGNRMGGGGGFTGTFGGGIAGHTVNSLLGSWGVDPITATAIGSGIGYTWPKVGEAFRRASNERTVRAAEEAVAQIRRNSPLYRAREAASPPIVDPFAMQRDAIAYSMLPQLSKAGAGALDAAHVPYDNRPPEE